MTTKTEALKRALEALMEHGTAYLGHSKEYQQAITKGKEALAQPEQEPVARIGMIDEEHFADVCRKANGNSNTLLFASPPKREWVYLTDDEREEIMEWLGHDVSSQVFYAIEAKLKEKNA
jgi:hypothetical protein